MNVSILRLRVSVHMQPAAASIAKALAVGWRPVIYLQGKYYAGRVVECDKPIETGQTAEALLEVMALAADVDVGEGSVLELRDGPRTVIATATVLPHPLF